MKLNYFNFKNFGNKVLMTNDFGKYVFVEKKDFLKILSLNIDRDSLLYSTLIEKEMIFDGSELEYSLAGKYALRTIKGHVNTATSLHIFVVTTKCNMSCVYCQANNGRECPHLMMDREMAQKAVDIALQSPEQYLSFEFQGGEPLINFEMIKFIVEYAQSHKENHEISYTIVTNLTLLNDEMLDFFVQHNFAISTSIDGNELVHNYNRPFANGEGTFQKVMESVRKIRKAGLHVGAIETTTKYSLAFPKEIIRAYVELGFDSIFIRPLTPLGKAAKSWDEIGYSWQEFIDFYAQAFEELIEINKNGRFIKEDHASILLKRIRGDFMNYMELRSPCGAGVGQLAYYADGNIFTCDEGRMLHEMGDSSFQLGNVYENTYTELIKNGVCRTVCASSVLESIPSCCDCVYQSYCGTCPVVNYALYKDVIEKEPRGYKCRIYSGILDYLFLKFYENDPETIGILNTWSE
ncbi:His-Xaa-Ser system radical SAM maturase HxsB [uncultured Dubosiella sp.]|uniref:His-Xaa-Ser system radical SAM maturase HxsB n=1 Tax=uncultured Dubosiella sp. TaxID=1937011 RepID=UPI0025B1E7EF|nr:His-Xaa-Ser system radical SAM maturase HxsB [uncultured Dubosiella sp.]